MSEGFIFLYCLSGRFIF